MACFFREDLCFLSLSLTPPSFLCLQKLAEILSVADVDACWQTALKGSAPLPVTPADQTQANARPVIPTAPSSL